MAATALHGDRPVAVAVLRDGDAVAAAALLDLDAVTPLGLGDAGARHEGDSESGGKNAFHGANSVCFAPSLSLRDIKTMQRAA
jgi:hypothetical protein